MSIFASPRTLRTILFLDAAICLISVPVLYGFAAPLAGMTGLPVSAVMGVAVVNLLFGVMIGFVATRKTLPRRGVMAVIILNAVWGVDTIALALLGWFPLTDLGQTVVIGQGVAALVAADLEYLGLRGQRPDLQLA